MAKKAKKAKKSKKPRKAKKAASAKRKPGRPKGTSNITRDVVVIPPVRCKCGSTRRLVCPNGTTEQKYAGIATDGQPYTHIVRTLCKCRDCGQHRVERTYEYYPKSA